MAGLVGSILGASTLGFLGGLLDDDGGSSKSSKRMAKAQVESSKISARTQRVFPGQKKLAEILAPFLAENLDVGLTEEEKDVYRTTGREAVDKATRGSVRNVERGAASQGLRGGSIANIISNLYEERAPAYGAVESDIMGMDIAHKRKRIADILGFLGLRMGYDEEEPVATSTPSPRRGRPVTDALKEWRKRIQRQSLGGPGAGLGGGGGDVGTPGMGGLGPAGIGAGGMGIL